MNELIKLAQVYENKATELRTQLESTIDKADRLVISSQAVIYQTMIVDIYTRILEIQKQN
jgi:hypothetical protein